MSTTTKPQAPSEPADTQLIPADSPLAPYIWIDRKRMTGAPCFAGTRVPLLTLFNYLSEGYPLAEFLDGFEGVGEEQAKEVLRLAFDRLFDSLPKA